ncbi:MAG TPA: lysylphosphatidylglycerol synthase transmembrane domain-containing protein [Bacteroidota bacterium]|nr:lysylphosphatidylglycerol synthase transmembrane domain-containing protein [Bacteroidota bacterium]
MKSIINYSLSFGLTLLFMYLAFRGKDMGQLWESVSGVSFIWFVVLALGGTISHVVRAWRWQYLLYPIKPNVSLRNSFSAVMIGYLVNNILPRVGEVVRPVAIGKLERISRSAAFGSVILERILDLITFGVILLLVLLFYASSFAKLFPTLANVEWVVLALSSTMLVVCVFVFLKAEFVFSLARKMTALLPRSFHTKAERIIDSFLTGFGASKQKGSFFMIAFTSLIIWVSYIVVMYLPFYPFGMIGTNGLDFSSATILMVVSGIAYAVPTPSGFGSYHFFTAFVLAKLFNVDTTVAAGYALYTHSLGFISTSVVGVYYLIVDKIHIVEIVSEPQSSID